jgi:hypothetical protein
VRAAGGGASDGPAENDAVPVVFRTTACDTREQSEPASDGTAADAGTALDRPAGR